MDSASRIVFTLDFRESVSFIQALWIKYPDLWETHNNQALQFMRSNKVNTNLITF